MSLKISTTGELNKICITFGLKCRSSTLKVSIFCFEIDCLQTFIFRLKFIKFLKIVITGDLKEIRITFGLKSRSHTQKASSLCLLRAYRNLRFV